MFDLFRRRDKAVRYLLTVLLGLVALSMVITLIPGYGSPRASSENILAEVAGDVITTNEVQSGLQGAVRNKQIPAEMLQFYVPQYIDQMIRERALAYQAKRMGFEISDEELAGAIRSLLYNSFPNGQIDRPTYQRFLAEQGFTIEQFEANVRKNLLLLRLQNLALEGVVVSPQEVSEEFHRRNDKFKFEYVEFSPAKYRAEAKVSPQDVQEYFTKNKSNFRTPERRSFLLFIADEAKVGASLNLSDADLLRAYQTNLDQFRTPERVKARHILIKTMDKSKEEQDKLAAKAADILKQLRGGADFADLAKKNSEDPGSAVKGGDLDWVTRGQTVKEFEDVAFTLKPKELSNLVKTQYGYHIIQVLEKEQARVKPFEEVKGEIANGLKRRTIYDRMQSGIEEAGKEVAKNPQQAQQIADKYSLILVKADKAAPGDPVPDVGTNPELQSNVTSTRANAATPVFQLSPTRLGLAFITAIEAPRQAEFADVETLARGQLLATKTNQIVLQKREEAAQKLRAANGDLEAAAQDLGLAPQTSDFLDANGKLGGTTVSAFADLLSKPIGATFGPVNSGDNVLMVKLVDKQVAEESKLTQQEKASIQTAIKRRKAVERRDLFEDGLVSRLTQEGKIKKYPEAIRRLGNAYRG